MVRASLIFASIATSAGACELVEAIAALEPASGAKTCAAYRSEGGNQSISCHWEFAFRDPKALEFSDHLTAQISSCAGGLPAARDQKVNHPDSYDLRTFASSNGTFFTSVKDKGALQKTLVFLRFEPSP